jgi:hypothetical protein
MSQIVAALSVAAISSRFCYISHVLKSILILVNQSLCSSKSAYIPIVKAMHVHIYFHLPMSTNCLFFYLVSQVTSIWLITSSSWCDFALLVSFVGCLVTHLDQWPFCRHHIIIPLPAICGSASSYSTICHLQYCIISSLFTT